MLLPTISIQLVVFYCRKLGGMAWIAQIKTANITARKREHAILWVWTFLAEDIVQKDIAKNSFVGKRGNINERSSKKNDKGRIVF